jgi:hypothetical protein
VLSNISQTLAYDIIPHAQPAKTPEARFAILREREPRLQPNGTWKRAYGYSDGSAETVELPTRDFDRWESEQATQ